MNIDALIQNLDLILTIVFASVLGMLAVSFICGLFRGWKSGTYRLLFLSIVAVALLAALGPLANFVGNFNLAQFNVPALNITIRGQVVSVVPTTVFETIKNFAFKVFKDVYHVKASIQAIENYAIAFAASFIRLILIAVIGVFTFSIGNLLCWLLWHIAFKFIIPKAKRKPKLRVVSGFEEVILIGLSMVLMITPFSAILNTFNKYVDPTKIPSKDQTVQLYQKVMKSYDESLLNKVFFAWTAGDGKNTIDTQLAAFLSGHDYQNTYGNVITEIRSIAGTGGSVFDALVGTKGSSETNSLALAPINIAATVTASLLTFSGEEGLSVLADLSALAGTLSSSYNEVVSYLGQDTASALMKKDRGIRYLHRCDEAYRTLVNGNVIETAVNPFAEFATLPVNDDPYEALTSSVALDSLNEISASPSKTAVIDSLLHGYLYRRSVDTGVKALMPLDQKDELKVDEFVSYSYVQEAKTIVSSYNKLNSFAPELTKSVAERIKMQQESASSESLPTTLINQVLNALADHPTQLLDTIIGPRDSNHEPVVDQHGLSEKGCLLDSGLVNAIMPPVLEIAAVEINDALLSQATQKVDFSDIAVTLQGDSSVENTVNDKREFGRMLDVVVQTMQNPYDASASQDKRIAGEAIALSMQTLLRDYRNHPGLDIDPAGHLYDYDSNIIKALANGLQWVDESKVLANAMPVFADYFLGQIQVLKDIGIQDIDTAPEDSSGTLILGDELAKLLSLGVQCKHLITSLGASTSGVSQDAVINLANKYPKELYKALDAIAGSAILNPMVNDNKNVNLVHLLNYLFSSLQLEDSLAENELNDIVMANGYATSPYIVDYLDGDPTTQNEDYALVNAISTIMECDILNLLSQSAQIQTISVDLSQDDKIHRVMTGIGGSAVLRRVAPSLFDDKLLKQFLDDGTVDLKSLGVSFTNLKSAKNWSDEGERFQDLINLAALGIDIANFDLFQDGTTIMELMSDLSGSKMFQPLASTIVDKDPALILPAEEGDYERYYTFPKFFSEKLITAAGSDNVKYFLDENPTGDSDIERCSSFVTACMELTRPVDWQINSEGTGEFNKLREMFVDLRSLGGFEQLSKIDGKSEPVLRSLLKNVTRTYTFSTVFTANALGDAMSKIEIEGSFDFKASYTQYFYDYDRPAGYNHEAKVAEMIPQIDSLMDLVTIIYDENNGLVKNGSLDFGNLNFTTISSERFIKPFLKKSHDSLVFHPTDEELGWRKEAFRAAHPETVFQQIVGSFMFSSGAYGVDKNNAAMRRGTPLNETVDTNGMPLHYPTSKSMIDIVAEIPEDNWDAEIEHIGDMIDFLQHSDFLDSQGAMSFDVFENIADFFGHDDITTATRKGEIGGLLNIINDSEIFRRALPEHLNKAIVNGKFGSELAGDMDCVDFYYSYSVSTDDYSRYPDAEITCLVNLFADLAACSDMEMTDIKSINGEAFALALTEMEGSLCFNSNKTKSNDIFDASSPKRNHTAFQNIVADVIANESLAGYLYYTGNPKDNPAKNPEAAKYNSALSKALYMVEKRCAYPATQSKGKNPDIISLGEFFDTIGSEALSGFFASGKGASFDKMDGTTLALILHALNDTYFLRDVVPSALHKTIGGETYAVEGVDLSLANVFFSYLYVDENGDLLPTPREEKDAVYDVPFYDFEIDQLCYIVGSLKDNKDTMTNLNVSTIDTMMLRTLLLDLSNSYVFHEAGAYTDSPTYKTTWFKFDDSYAFVGAGKHDIRKNDLSIFEQFIQRIYLESTLYEQNLNITESEDDLILYLGAKDGTAGYFGFSVLDGSEITPQLKEEAYKRAAARFKLHENIAAFTAGTFVDIKGGALETHWIDEINALTTDGHQHDPSIDKGGKENDAYQGLIQVVQDLGLSTEDVELGNSKLNLYEPYQLYNLFYALNECTIVHEALANSFASFISSKSTQGTDSGLGLDAFSNDTHSYPGPYAGKFVYDSDDYGMLSRISFDYDFTGIDPAGDYRNDFTMVYSDGTHNWDVTDLLITNKVATSPQRYIINVAKVPGSFTIASAKTGVTFSNVEVIFDRADYRQTQETYRVSGIPSVYYFFTSTFRGQKSPDTKGNPDSTYYYSFSEENHSLTDFLDDTWCASGFKHSTYGLFFLLIGSGLFDNVDKDTGDFAAKDYSLYKMFDINTTIPVVGAVSLPMGSEFGSIYLDDPYDSSRAIHGMTKDLVGDGQKDFSFKEAAYIDQYITDIGFVDAFINNAYWNNSQDSMKTNTEKIGHFTGIEQTAVRNTASENYQHIVKYASSSVYATPYQITLYGALDKNDNFITESDKLTEPGAMMKTIQHALARKLSISWNVIAKGGHSDFYPEPYYSTMNPGMPNLTGDRSAFMDTTTYPVDFADIDEAFDRSGGKLDVTQSVGKIFEALAEAVAKDKNGFADVVETFDNGNASSQRLFQQFFYGDLYDLLSRSPYSTSSIPEVPLVEFTPGYYTATDLIYDRTTTANNVLAGVAGQDFTYANVAIAIRNAA